MRRTMKLTMAALALVGSAGLHAQSAPRAATFDPAAFFTGRTVSQGTLSQIFSSTKETNVTTFGTLRAPGDMELDQQVTIGNEPTRQRTWRLRETAPGRFAGTITDAGPVSGSVSGNALTLTYTLDNNLNVHQVVTVNPGGQSAENVMRIRRFGITVARLTETIRRERS
ncbi:DUF3833 domain-containing protein [Altererythrobacter sp. KTW20L]|uniref:DUF3833 family protein n=1 Tax=Altererythrobacter sp. KTW20L TaxID=2942210 RepID=UPI0020C0A18D|nr:DUF3833 domain-containing protein [Altererythrobacter sp. KTW20L]